MNHSYNKKYSTTMFTIDNSNKYILSIKSVY